MSHSGAASSSLPLDRTHEQPVVVASRIVHKFFEPIILLVALTEAVQNLAAPRPLEPEIDVRNPKQLFCAFVNKLGNVCSKEKGANCVTSFVVLQDEKDPDMVHFIFAMNRQTDVQLQSTAAYVSTLLRKVGQAPDGRENQRDARRSLLYHILRFNRPRVSFYLRELREKAASCLEKCEAERTDDNELVAEELKVLLDSPSAGSKLEDSEADYIRNCETTIQQLIRVEEFSIVGEIIEDRALQDRISGFKSRECWAELLHVIRRILAYQQSVQFFLSAKEMWPNLFENFTVDFISSSREVERPFRRKSLSAEGIVGRMTRKEKEMAIFKEFVRKLQDFNLDDRIKQEYSRDTFKPFVHAEVLLLNWISNQGEILPSRFFNDWMYIGSSKPTCKLCEYYFQEHKSNVERRAPHGNLYANWRVPDVFPYQGDAAIDARQIMLDRVLQRVRKEAFAVVRRKAFPGIKDNDSNTFSDRMTLLEIRSLHSSNADVDDLASIMGEVDIS
ncbi:hypothetical protein TrVFT333_006898 [Trichoderma virens FT-333]|nr:hypothetical protein TrVFT333_006898 [Trichoderma virens FT-333]